MLSVWCRRIVLLSYITITRWVSWSFKYLFYFLDTTFIHLTENQSVSGVATIYGMQRDTSPSHRVDQAVDCGLWNVVPLLFNGCVKLRNIGGNWNTLLYRTIQSIPNMLNG